MARLPGEARTLLIAGGGIAGLACGLALARRGVSSEIFERVAEMSPMGAAPVGAGLQLGPNAVHALMGLGMADAVRRVAVAPDALVLRRARDGAVLGRVPLGAVAEARYGAPYWVVHRAELYAALLRAVRAEPRIVLRTGADVSSFDVRDDGVAVTLADGDNARGAALVGADGVWSGVRAQMFPEVAVVPSGYVAYRAILPVSDAVTRALGTTAGREIGAWLATDAHVVHYPIKGSGGDNGGDNGSGGGRDSGSEGAGLVNVVVIVKSAWSMRDVWSAAADGAEVRAALSALPDGVSSLVGMAQWSKWSLAAPVVVPGLSRGRVALVGDAGHATLPFLAQGTAMALEDAVVLAGFVADAAGDGTADMAAAFRRYDAARRERVRRVQARSSRNGRVFHLAGPMALARDAVIGALPEAMLLRQWDWLYGHKV